MIIIKKISLFFSFFLLVNVCFAQSDISGTWYDQSSKDNSIISFLKEGKITLDTSTSPVFDEKKIIKGNYTLKDGLLKIQWEGGSITLGKLAFLNSNTFKLTILNKTSSSLLRSTGHVYSKIVDEEVIIPTNNN